jgi:hypothetical protein
MRNESPGEAGKVCTAKVSESLACADLLESLASQVRSGEISVFVLEVDFKASANTLAMCYRKN